MLKHLVLTSALCISLTACAQEADKKLDVTPKPEPTPISAEIGMKGEGWRKISPENLVLMDTKYGQIVIELNPEFAPGHVKRFQDMVKARAYNGQEFYRVIDGFVAQGGINTIDKKWPPIEIEVEQPLGDGTNIQLLGNDDLFAPEVGFQNGFAVGLDREIDKKWLLHCPGALAMARDSDPNTGGTDFYIVLDAQRYLDRNLTVFGRVISGMQYVQKLQRGDKDIASGVIQAPQKGDQIISAKLASELEPNEQPNYEVMHTDTPAFMNKINSKRVQSDPFFFNTPPQVVDVCDMDVPTELVDF
ncbi:peptidylprolyl isomerase [Hirschia litorea]|uniref:peptidylprolyl isomerase n=1 Tax=Hirschia litorea TaxID=1199156 RepID=A0ABW2IN22_9PROT